MSSNMHLFTRFFSKAFFYCWKMKKFFHAEFFFIHSWKSSFQEEGEKCVLAIDLLFWWLLHSRSWCASHCNIWGKTFWIMDRLGKYSCFLWFDVRNTFAVSLSDVGVVVHSKRKKVHWPLKRGKVFQVTLLSQLWCIEEKSASFSALTDYTAAFLPNCFGHIFWFLARTRPAVLGWLENK